MKRLNALLCFVVALVFVVSSDAATTLSRTTLSAAVSSTSNTIVVVASATGITATVTALYVDSEYMTVNAVNGTTLSVTRQGRGETHLSGATVWFGPPAAFKTAQPAGFPAGSCNRATELFLPWINVASGVISDCLGGVWVQGVTAPLQNTPFRMLAPNSGGTVYTSLGGTGTAPVSGTLFCTEIDLPFNKLLTGIGILNGTVVGTDNHLVMLYDASGNLLANSATAGVLAASASAYQNISFTSTYFAVGPATYFGCAQSNGTTATIRMITAGTQDTFLTKSIAGVFGTVPATIVVPTTFTTAVGPYEFAF